MHFLVKSFSKIFLVMALAFGASFAQENVSLDFSADTAEIDSTEIYRKLFRTERKKARAAPKIVGISIGSGLLSLGTLYSAMGMSRLMTEKRGSYEADLGAVLLTIGLPMLAAGGPLFAANLYNLIHRKEHAQKRDEYQKAYERCRKRRQNAGLEGVRLTIVPTFDVASAGRGVKLLVEF